MRAYPFTSAAVQALCGFKKKLWFGAKSFRVVAPCATEWAALEEDRRADAIAVMETKFTDFKYRRALHEIKYNIMTCHNSVTFVTKLLQNCYIRVTTFSLKFS